MLGKEVFDGRLGDCRREGEGRREGGECSDEYDRLWGDRRRGGEPRLGDRLEGDNQRGGDRRRGDCRRGDDGGRGENGRERGDRFREGGDSRPEGGDLRENDDRRESSNGR